MTDMVETEGEAAYAQWCIESRKWARSADLFDAAWQRIADAAMAASLIKESMVEKVARAMAERNEPGIWDDKDRLPGWDAWARGYIGDARAAVAAHNNALKAENERLRAELEDATIRSVRGAKK
jgi:hypothetical protein